jgi:hypothetical protein
MGVVANEGTLAGMNWRRAKCLAGCGTIVKRQRDAWIELGGTRDGRWLTAMSVDPGLTFADPLPAPDEVLLLGVAHRTCLEMARRMLREQRVSLDDDLPRLLIEEVRDEEWSGRETSEPTPEGECPFCQGFGPNPKMTDEDIYPQWLLRELKRRGARSRRGDVLSEKIYRVTAPTCGDCNSGWMSTLENDVKDLIVELIDHTKELNVEEQRKLALWATLKAVLFDARAEARLIPRRSGQEINIRREPPRGTYVWVAAYMEGKNALAIDRRPIYSDVVTPEGEHKPGFLTGICVTFTIVRVAFQVLIPFVKGSLGRLEDFNDSVIQIWPPIGKRVDWPPRFHFDGESFEALATRIYDGHQPVVMNVALHEAVRARPENSNDHS